MTEEKWLKVGQIKINEYNPRTITGEQFRRLVDSLLAFPKMLDARQIVVDEYNVALGGNMRAQALQFISRQTSEEIARRLADVRDFVRMQPDEQSALLSYWGEFKGNPVVKVYDASGWTEEEKRQFIIKDNASFGKWDFDMLANLFDETDLPAWGVDVWQMENPNDGAKPQGGNAHEDIDDATGESPREGTNAATGAENGQSVDETADVEVIEDEPIAESEETPHRVKVGDVWALGAHRLFCGDCTKSESYSALMAGKKAALVFTDPPYGMGKEKDGVANDNQNNDELLEFNRKWIPQTFANATANASWYCWGIDEPLMDIYAEIIKPMQKRKEAAFRNLITWDKWSGQGQNSDEFRMYPIADEKCLFVMKGRENCINFAINKEDYNPKMDKIRLYFERMIKSVGENDETIANALGWKCGRTVNHWYSKSQFILPTKENYIALCAYVVKKTENRELAKEEYDTLKAEYDTLKAEYDTLKAEYDTLKAEYDKKRSYFNNTHDNQNNVWHFPRTTGSEREDAQGHATPKPVALCARAIKSSSRPLDIVLDVFGGSGSTLIACEQLQRVCYIMELQERYCDVIIRRWERLTGQIATKIKSYE